MRRFITLDEFAELPDAEQRDGNAGISTVSVDQPEFVDDSRIITYTFSTPAVARDMHTVAANAWQTDAFEKNPVFLWAHDDSLPPIGRIVNLGDVGGKLKGGVEYTDRDLNPFGDMIFRMVKARFLNAVSTSWLPLAWSRSTDKGRPGGIDFKKVDLLEISQVPIPAQATALAEARAAGIDTGPMFRWAEKVLDIGGGMVLPRDEVEQLRRAAKMPAAAKTADSQTATIAVKHARAIARAPKVPVFKRGLYDVAQLAYLVNSLGYCHDSAEYEADLEQDNSPVPGMLGEALIKLGEAFKAMAIEEIDEFMATHGGNSEEEVEVETRALSSEQRAFINAAKSVRARAWRAGTVVARAGKALSSSNKEKIDSADSHCDRAMKHSRALNEHHDAVSGHLKDARSAHDKTTGTLEDLGEHLRAAQDEPDKAQDHLKRAAKSHGETEKNLGAVADSHSDLADRHADADDSHNAMNRSIKSAQRCMRAVTSGAVTSDADDTAADSTESSEAAKEKKARALEKVALATRLARAQELAANPPAASVEPTATIELEVTV